MEKVTLIKGESRKGFKSWKKALEYLNDFTPRNARNAKSFIEKMGYIVEYNGEMESSQTPRKSARINVIERLLKLLPSKEHEIQEMEKARLLLFDKIVDIKDFEKAKAKSDEIIKDIEKLKNANQEKELVTLVKTLYQEYKQEQEQEQEKTETQETQEQEKEKA